MHCRHLILGVWLFTGLVLAQENVPLIRKQTGFVTVPTVVRDSNGRFVRGLAANDFRVFENGHEVKLTSFEEADAKPEGEPTRGSFQEPRAPHAAILVLLLDEFNTPADEQAPVRERLAAFYANTVASEVPTCVVLYDGNSLHIVRQPTMDATAIAKAIRGVGTIVRNGGGAGAAGDLPVPYGARENMVVDTPEDLRALDRLSYFALRHAGAGSTEDALSSLAKLFAPLPGEKIVIWATAGTTVDIHTSELLSHEMKLYALNEHMMIPYFSAVNVPRADTRYLDDQETNDQLLRNLRDAAEQTGGGLCNDDLHPGVCIQRAVEDSSSYYLLGYHAHYDGKRPEWREIRVKVHPPGLRVQARSAVLLQPTIDLEREKRGQLQAALSSPFDLPGILMELKAGVASGPSSVVPIRLIIHSDGQHPAPWSGKSLDLTITGEVLKDGEAIANFGEELKGPINAKEASELAQHGLAWSRTLKVMNARGDIELKLAARDNLTGRIGSVRRSLTSALPTR